MLIRLLRNFSLVFVLIVSGVALADDGPEAAMKEFVAAFNSKDAAGLAALFHDDAKLLPAGYPIVTGVKDIEVFWAEAFESGLSGIEKTPIETIVNKDLAVETSSWFITFNDAKLAGKDTLVWRKNTEGEWKISTDIWAYDQE